MTDPIFDSTMEQRLLSAHANWMQDKQVFLENWQQAQDLLIFGNLVLSLGMYASILVLAHRVHKLEGANHATD